MRAVRYVPNSEWPYGHGTATCPTCKGTGADAAKLTNILVTSRAPVTDLDGVKCPACEGRGRVIAEAEAARS